MQRQIILSIVFFISISSCSPIEEPKEISDENWFLGWRMMESTWSENMELAENQFDSLLMFEEPLSELFLVTGLDVKVGRDREGEVVSILKKQSKSMLSKICFHEFTKKYKECHSFSQEKISNVELQMEIIGMYVNDQAVRGNIKEDMKKIISKYTIDAEKIIYMGDIVIYENFRDEMKEVFWNYGFSDEELEIINSYIDSQPDGANIVPEIVSKHGLDSTSFISPSMTIVDKKNRTRLDEIIKQYGFPTREIIGKDAMDGVFYIILHADGDKEWQSSQLQNVKQAADNGDLSKSNYAYLFDRFKVNHEEPQRYGSQIKNVNKNKGTVELREIEDIENLNQRRKEMGMKPIEVYKRRLLRK